MVDERADIDRTKPKVVLLFGPTGTGKSDLALDLAAGLGEIVSADSMQVYRYMDIGTAKLSLEERRGIPHHLIDIADPDEEYTARRFRDEAISLIRQIAGRGKIPFVVGGTGFYLKALVDGLFEGPARDEALRSRLEAIAQEHGSPYLHGMLKDVDPERALSLSPNDTKRIVRALEVWELTGRTMTDCFKDQTANEAFDFLKIGLTVDRKTLYTRLDHRCDKMLDRGLVNEVRRLIDMGYSRNLPSMQGIGYRQIAAHLMGDTDYPEAIRLFKRDSRRLAKRQWTLFRPIPGTSWHEPGEITRIRRLVEDFMTDSNVKHNQEAIS
ncbi:MAG: tRNA (adenosine(37)-N6)-dimethylallyltransferase MiaA [Spirochaetota bacterium]|nr:tRNA (adenosine(37)-N6)-dimethylallyltransferase MiaA [Spirochaetota bacterium]